MSSQEEKCPVVLWYVSRQGIVRGQRVHVGQRATLYPGENHAVIEKWGPSGSTREVIATPEGMTDKTTAILYLNGYTSVPSDVLRGIRRNMRSEQPREPSLLLPDGSAVSSSGKKLVGFQRSATGYFNYGFFYEQEEVCTVSSLSLRPSLVTVSGMGRSWSSSFDADAASAVSGTGRLVKDSDTKRDILQIRRLEEEHYLLLFDKSEVTAYPNSTGYHFVLADRQIAYLDRITEYPWQPEESYFEIQPGMIVTLQDNIATDIILGILTFPCLRY